MAALPNAMRVTVGLLARDGFAAQLKLKKTPGVHEAYRCARTGVYWVYEPSGGSSPRREGEASFVRRLASKIKVFPAIILPSLVSGTYSLGSLGGSRRSARSMGWSDGCSAQGSAFAPTSRSREAPRRRRSPRPAASVVDASSPRRV